MRLFRTAAATALAVLATSAVAVATTVEECIQLALEQAPAVRGAGFDVEQAAARVRAAKAAYVPRLLAQGAYGKSWGFDEVVTDGGRTAALVTVEATFFDGGLRQAQLATARAHLRSASALERQRRADVVRAVRISYASALEARREAEVHGSSSRALRDAIALLQRQEDLGLVPHNDVLRAELAASVEDAGIRSAEEQLAIALRDLEILTGATMEGAALAPAPVQVGPEAGEDALAESPVVADAQAAAEAARGEADAVHSEGRPKIGLTASGGALGVQPDQTFRDNGGGEFLFGIDVPLFDGGATSARIAAAIAASNSAQAALDQSRQNLRAELARLQIEAARAAADRTAWQRVTERAQENFVLARARYFGGGNVRLLEVLDALSQWVEVRLNLARAELALAVAAATQRQLLGDETT